eukprot:CAMPEP_0185586142 /NCGR_PEP_ID=MMETSP0434-20130131/42757_1 /TAXON_ID=626734 ORGANISM="Favella taraikaensis, Strain Fe Narragansett Bay" /NCGR_SAMPLE_ID=MMETSP0434 /ASSEMBLY_ACC=CAM_ASM_000379 /LENGTH=64 /DNA_ID=CAMNT_0028207039 /DNA_START=159 /DNA_END=353 /DNA_ORIENTATION=+
MGTVQCSDESDGGEAGLEPHSQRSGYACRNELVQMTSSNATYYEGVASDASRDNLISINSSARP